MILCSASLEEKLKLLLYEDFILYLLEWQKLITFWCEVEERHTLSYISNGNVKTRKIQQNLANSINMHLILSHKNPTLRNPY